MELYRIDTPAKRRDFLLDLGCDKSGATIMAAKMETLLFAVRGLSVGAANILKQDALAVGADLAVPGGVVICKERRYDAILMGTRRQLARLARKELAQPFGLKNLGRALSTMLKTYRYDVKIMGVINANDDSFYPGSRFQAQKAVAAIEGMIAAGAEIIDIGAVSSRPGSLPVPPEEELKRLRPILEAVRAHRLYEKARFSIDSYAPEAVEAALTSGFSIVNDIRGLSDPRLGELAVRYGADYVIMHMKGDPATMQHDPRYDDVTAEVDAFFAERIERAESLGLKRESLILDPGIGFGKSLAHNLTLIKNLAHFLHHGCEVLIGASRKSMIDKVIPAPVEARLPGTLAIHLEAVRRGASVVRCHDVAEHKQALMMQQAIEKGDVI